jgi:hypothetical protein
MMLRIGKAVCTQRDQDRFLMRWQSIRADSPLKKAGGSSPEGGRIDLPESRPQAAPYAGAGSQNARRCFRWQLGACMEAGEPCDCTQCSEALWSVQPMRGHGLPSCVLQTWRLDPFHNGLAGGVGTSKTRPNSATFPWSGTCPASKGTGGAPLC